MLDNKELYKLFCDSESEMPIFSQYWWMDAVCGEDNWDVVLIERGGETIASLPYYLGRKLTMKYITQPKLTQSNGVYIKYPIGQKYTKKLSYEHKITNELINELEKLNISYFNQNFSRLVMNVLPWHWANYNINVRYTYEVKHDENFDKIEIEFDSKLRNQLKKAQKNIKVNHNCSIEELFDLVVKTYSRQNRKPPYSSELLRRIDNVCKKKNQSISLYATDQLENIHAAIYLVWDRNTMYYIIGASDPEYRNSQANLLLIYEAMKIAHNKNLNFDFEGSMNESIESFFRQFGAKQQIYFNITKNYKGKLLIELYKIINSRLR